MAANGSKFSTKAGMLEKYSQICQAEGELNVHLRNYLDRGGRGQWTVTRQCASNMQGVRLQYESSDQGMSWQTSCTETVVKLWPFMPYSAPWSLCFRQTDTFSSV